MIRAVIFDLGGVLVRTEDALIHAVYDSLDIHNIPKPPRELVIKYVGITDYELVKNSIPEEYRTQDNIEKCYVTFKEIFPRDYMKEFKEIEDVSEILENLKERNIKIALATGFKKDVAETILEFYGWSKYFDVIVTHEDFEKPRPDPEIVLAAIEKLHVKNDECLYVDDTFNGFKSGKAAKVKTVIVLSGAQSKEIRIRKNDIKYVLPSVASLPEFLRVNV